MLPSMKLPTGRQVLAAIAISFVVYAVLKDPADSAHTTSGVVDSIKDGANSVGTFFDVLLND